MENVLDFFKKKYEWSKYKDLILNYYLEPYLFKVAKLNKPIVIVDCFAGPGKFGDGELGSPLIISEKLNVLNKAGAKVSGYFIEHNAELFSELQKNIEDVNIPIEIRHGSFRDFIPDLAELAKSSTMFVYVDPIKPTDLLFDDLKNIYDCLKIGQSVETLINFMSTNFWRATKGVKDIIFKDGAIDKENITTIRWNNIAGGTYWQDISYDTKLNVREITDNLTKGYAEQLKVWFKYVLNYAIREKYGHERPKYHLVFGSRYPDAVDLMNRAMVKARREFVGKSFIQGMLFHNQPAKEVVDPVKIKERIISASKRIGKTSWKLLRVEVTIENPSMYTDSEINNVIKKCIKSGALLSNCSGNKKEEDAFIWLP